MSQVAINLLMFLRSVPGTACCVGAAAYLGWTALFAFGLRQLPAGAKGEVAVRQQPRQRQTLSRRSAIIALSVLAATAVCIIRTHVQEDITYDCDAHFNAELDEAANEEESSLAPLKRGAKASGPKSKMLARAYAAIEMNRNDTDVEEDESCPNFPSTMFEDLSVSAIEEQLVCYRQQLHGELSAKEVAALLEHGRQALSALRGREAEDRRSVNASKVQWANVALFSLQTHCSSISSRLQEVRQSKNGAQTSALTLTTFRAMKRLEYSFEETHTAVSDAEEILMHRSEELEDLQERYGTARSCLVGAVREARLLSAALTQLDETMQRARRCEPNMMESFEQLILSATAADVEASTRFNLGMYWSDMEMNVRSAPLFTTMSSGEGKWVRDAQGSHVPENFAAAEHLMELGEQGATESQLSDRAATRALRLYQHAKALALKHHDVAAEWRFKSAARLAAKHHRQKLAAHSLARLSYFVMLRGRHREALALARNSLKHTSDPLALFIQVTLRRSLGELRTDDDMRRAEEQLKIVANKLPSKGLEDQRAAAHTEMGLWRAAADGGYRECFALGDTAHVAICLFCKLVFG